MIENINGEPFSTGKLAPAIRETEAENRQRLLDNMKKVKAEIDEVIGVREEVWQLRKSGRIDQIEVDGVEDSDAFFAHTSRVLFELRGHLVDMVRSFKDMV